MQGLGLLLLRCAAGAICITHGLPKLIPIGGGSPRDAAALFEASGLAPPLPLAVGTGLVEVAAGAALVAGAYTVWTGLVLLVTHLAVAWSMHPPVGSSLGLGLPGEQGILLAAAFACLTLAGPGVLSVDRRRARLAATLKLTKAQVKAGKI